MQDREYRTVASWTIEKAQARFRPGDSWAYRAGIRGDFLEARVHSVDPHRRPARVKVILFEDGFEVVRQSVAPARLWVPWGEVHAVRESEARWRRVRSVVPPEPEVSVASWALIDQWPELWNYYDDRCGVGVIRDSHALATRLGLPIDDLHDPLGFDEPDGRVVGWSVVRRMAQAALLIDDGHRARQQVRLISQWREQRARVVEERLKVREFDWELKYLPEDHRAFDASDPDADEQEAGLQALLPGILEVQAREDARRLLLDAVRLLTRLRPELQRARATNRQKALDAEIETVISRAARLDVRDAELDG